MRVVSAPRRIYPRGEIGKHNFAKLAHLPTAKLGIHVALRLFIFARLTPRMPPATAGLRVARFAPYRRPEKKWSNPLLCLPLELWVGFIIPSTPTSILMLMRAVCAAWKELADPELEKRHRLLGLPVWLGNQPPFSLADFTLPSMVIVTERDLGILDEWTHFICDCPRALPMQALEKRRTSRKDKRGILGIPTNTHTVLLNPKLDRMPDCPKMNPINDPVDILCLPFKNDASLRPKTLILWNGSSGPSSGSIYPVHRLIVIGGTLRADTHGCRHLVLYGCRITWEVLSSCLRRVESVFIDNCLINSRYNITPVHQNGIKKASIGRIEWMRTTDISAIAPGIDTIIKSTFEQVPSLHLGAVHDEYLDEVLISTPWEIERPYPFYDPEFRWAKFLSKVAPGAKVYGFL